MEAYGRRGVSAGARRGGRAHTRSGRATANIRRRKEKNEHIDLFQSHLVGEALGDRLDVAERRLAGAGGDQEDGLVDAAQRRDIHGLPADDTARADAGGILARARVDDGVHNHLHRVLVRLRLRGRVRRQAVSTMRGIESEAREQSAAPQPEWMRQRASAE